MIVSFLFGAYIMGAIIAFLITAFFTILGGKATFIELVLNCLSVAIFYPFILFYYLINKKDKHE